MSEAKVAVVSTCEGKWDGVTGYCCATCRFFAPGEQDEMMGRCRRRAPTMGGYPVVFGEVDWCGEHKLGTNPSKARKK